MDGGEQLVGSGERVDADRVGLREGDVDAAADRIDGDAVGRGRCGEGREVARAIGGIEHDAVVGLVGDVLVALCVLGFAAGHGGEAGLGFLGQPVMQRVAGVFHEFVVAALHGDAPDGPVRVPGADRGAAGAERAARPAVGQEQVQGAGIVYEVGGVVTVHNHAEREGDGAVIVGGDLRVGWVEHRDVTGAAVGDQDVAEGGDGDGGGDACSGGELADEFVGRVVDGDAGVEVGDVEVAGFVEREAERLVQRVLGGGLAGFRGRGGGGVGQVGERVALQEGGGGAGGGGGGEGGDGGEGVHGGAPSGGGWCGPVERGWRGLRGVDVMGVTGGLMGG